MHERVLRFKEVVEAVIGEEIDFEVYVELLLGHGINSMLADLLSPLDHESLLKSIQQLGSLYPANVYGYVEARRERRVGGGGEATARIPSIPLRITG